MNRDSDLQKFFVDAVEVARASTEVIAAAKLINSLNDAGCSEAQSLRARFIEGVAARDDMFI